MRATVIALERAVTGPGIRPVDGADVTGLAAGDEAAGEDDAPEVIATEEPAIAATSANSLNTPVGDGSSGRVAGSL